MLTARHITKRFQSVTALSRVDFDLKAGEVHALFGANGAGKSTLAKVITGQIAPDEGTIALAGEAKSFARPRDALDAGIGIVTQEMSLASDLAVWENIILPRYGARGRVRRSELKAVAHKALAELGHADDFDLDAPASELSSAQRQIVEIAKAIALEARVIIFDEPTASLSPSETARLFAIMERLREDGRGMIFVSHRLEEIFTITDRITVLRDGKAVAQNVATNTLDQNELIRLMVGREIGTVTRGVPVDRSSGPLVLSVEGLAAPPLVRDVSFAIHAGEIVGLGGLVGSGRSEIAETLFGLRRRTAGTVSLFGRAYRPTSPTEAIRSGVGFLAEDRRRQSIVPDLSVRENILLAHLGARRAFTRGYSARAAKIVELADLMELPRHRLADDNLLNFSGGMQQKALIMRSLILDPKLLILDEPTKGVDVGSRASIYALLRRLADEGLAILLISSDFEELMALSHRIVPISDGRSIGSVPTELIDEEQLTLLAAPRASMGKQIAILDGLAEAHGGAAFWALLSRDTVLTLAASESAEALTGLGAGAVRPYGETRIPSALGATAGEEPPQTFVAEADGASTLLIPVASPRGHDLGWIGLTLPDGARVPDTADVAARLAERLRLDLENQVRIKLTEETT